MKRIRSLLLGVIACAIGLTSCSCSGPSLQKPASALYNIDDATTIILHLMHSDKLSTILEDHSKEQLLFLTKNFSPAEIAFESEVISCTLPVLVYFFDPKSPEHTPLLAVLEKYAHDNEDTIKIVIIDVTYFIFLAENLHISSLPTFVLFKNQKEVARKDHPANFDVVKTMIAEHIS